MDCPTLDDLLSRWGVTMSGCLGEDDGTGGNILVSPFSAIIVLLSTLTNITDTKKVIRGNTSSMNRYH